MLLLAFKVVYNANKLSELVSEKKKKQNWLDYYQLKFARKQLERPRFKVIYSWLSNCLAVLMWPKCFFFSHFKVLTTCWEYVLIQKQGGFLGCYGESVDAIDFYSSEIERLSKEVRTLY